MTEEEYRSASGISRSALWRIAESPEKFKWEQDHPSEPTQALIFGQVVHKMLLEPKTFHDDFAIIPAVDKRTKEGKMLYQSWLIGNGDKTKISAEDFRLASEMIVAVNSVPMARKLLNGQHELPLYWTDEATGEDCKVRLDALREVGEKLIIVDYKTTNDASTDGFMRSAIKYGYDFQTAMYIEGVKQALNRDADFVFIVQEKDPPYSVNILAADKLFVQRGYDRFRELLGIYHKCKVTDNWYGYLGEESQINVLGLPAWLMEKE